MIRWLKIFAVLLGAIYLGLELNRDPGYVLISFHNWTLELTFAIAVAILLISFISFFYLLNIISAIVALPSCLRRWQNKRRVIQAQSKTEQGIIEFGQGYWYEAKNNLIEALPNTSMPLLNYLTAAQAAQALGDIKLREQYLTKAQCEIPKATLAISLTRIQMQLANKEWAKALVSLKSLQILYPYHPQIIKLLIELYQQVEDWFALINLLPEIRHSQILSFEAFQQLRKKGYLQAISNYIAHCQTKELNKFIKKMPQDLLKESKIVSIYCDYLIDQKDYLQAEYYLKRLLSKSYHEHLILLYGQLPGSLSSLQFAESLLKQYTQSATLYYSLSQLSRKQNLWGKARQYLEKSIALEPTYKAYCALGQLLESLGNEPEAYKAYRQGLLLVK